MTLNHEIPLTLCVLVWAAPLQKFFGILSFFSMPQNFCFGSPSNRNKILKRIFVIQNQTNRRLRDKNSEKLSYFVPHAFFYALPVIPWPACLVRFQRKPADCGKTRVLLG